MDKNSIVISHCHYRRKKNWSNSIEYRYVTEGNNYYFIDNKLNYTLDMFDVCFSIKLLLFNAYTKSNFHYWVINVMCMLQPEPNTRNFYFLLYRIFGYLFLNLIIIFCFLAEQFSTISFYS